MFIWVYNKCLWSSVGRKFPTVPNDIHNSQETPDCTDRTSSKSRWGFVKNRKIKIIFIKSFYEFDNRNSGVIHICFI